MLRLGLCCKFASEPIKFRDTTAAALARMPQKLRAEKLAELCLANADALLSAINYCAASGIGCFRINSRILPLYTHPKFGYTLNRLPNGTAIRKAFVKCRAAASELGIRLTFHPDQFILLNSPGASIVRASVKELKYQAMMSELVGADVITIHAGGAYGDKPAALRRFERAFAKLPKSIRARLAVENDDRLYTPADLLPLCKKLRVK